MDHKHKRTTHSYPITDDHPNEALWGYDNQSSPLGDELALCLAEHMAGRSHTTTNIGHNG